MWKGRGVNTEYRTVKYSENEGSVGGGTMVRKQRGEEKEMRVWRGEGKDPFLVVRTCPIHIWTSQRGG